MRGSSAVCWSLLLLVALFSHSITAKGGRGGARGGARGSSRGTSRVRVKSPTRYGSFRVAAGAAAAGAVAGAAAGLAGKRRWRYDDSSEVGRQWGNNTDEGLYSYRAWTSDSCPLSFSWPLTLMSCTTAILKYCF
ncbi:shadow of prion [Pelobates cultripes]|uniref:Shadow of prion protein n=1 Tax=Pelobates cultripes TaxID=61616 RepID=A0AAD1T9A1_PELCU|nr:shadow of prion [Pelobates cultripes]